MKKLIAALLALLLALSCILPALAEPTKHERVYIVADPDGNVLSLTDNIRLENPEGLEEIVDASLLTAIENVGGSEAFTRDGDALIWQAQGQDIIYQGTSDQAPALLPTVTLTLDGEAVSAAELKDRTGKAVLTVACAANTALPALTVTVLPLPAAGMTDIQLENAAILSEAGQRVLVGYAVPGADAALGLPDHFTVSFHADHADLSWMMTLISADPIRLACGEIDSRLETDLRGTLDLADSMLTALKSGKDLPLLPGREHLKVNMVLTQVNNFFHSLTKLDEDAQALSAGAEKLAEGAQALRDGMAEAQTGAEALQGALNGLQAEKDAVTAGADALLTAAFQSANAQLTAAGLTVPELTAENYAELLDAAVQGLDEAAAAPVAALKGSLAQAVDAVNGMKAYADAAAQAAGGAAALNASVAALADGAETLQKSAASLQKNTAKFRKDGTAKLNSTVTASVKQLAALAQPYVQNDLAGALSLYEQTRDQAQNGGYDLRPEGMQAVTVYIIRTDLQ